MENLNYLFHIFCEDKKQRRNLDVAHSLRMCSEDCDFYHDQKTTRVSKCTAVIEKSAPSDVKFKQPAKDQDWTRT